MPKKLDIKISFHCNNHCDFCIQGDKRDYFKARSYESIFEEMEIARKEDDADQICITGGEPTLHKDIIKIVAAAKKLGYTSIIVQSNGSRFSDMFFFLGLVRAGITHFGPSIHGSTAEIHDNLVHRKGAFDQIMSGLELSKRFGQKLLMNTVITTRNYKDLPKIAKLLIPYKPEQVQLAFPHIGGSAEKNASWLVPKKTECLPYVKQALDLLRKEHLHCIVEAVPFCLMQGYEECITENYVPDVKVVDGEGITESYNEYKLTDGKKKHEKCSLCMHNEDCEGPWKEYPELFGWDEFVPVTEECATTVS